MQCDQNNCVDGVSGRVLRVHRGGKIGTDLRMKRPGKLSADCKSGLRVARGVTTDPLGSCRSENVAPPRGGTPWGLEQTGRAVEQGRRGGGTGFHPMQQSRQSPSYLQTGGNQAERAGQWSHRGGESDRNEWSQRGGAGAREEAWADDNLRDEHFDSRELPHQSGSQAVHDSYSREGRDHQGYGRASYQDSGERSDRSTPNATPLSNNRAPQVPRNNSIPAGVRKAAPPRTAAAILGAWPVGARRQGALAPQPSRATRSSESVPRTPFFLCLRVLIFETPEIFAISRVFVQARKTAQKPEKTLIFRKLADEHSEYRHIGMQTVEKSVFFRAFAPFSARLHALGKQYKNRASQISGPRNRGKMASEGRNVHIYTYIYIYIYIYIWL